ncbi:hypothetical protein Hanom_Chr16g01455491 [Helianthus anomalus]
MDSCWFFVFRRFGRWGLGFVEDLVSKPVGIEEIEQELRLFCCHMCVCVGRRI